MITRTHRFGVDPIQPPAGAAYHAAPNEQVRPVAGGWFSRLFAWFRLPDFDECRDAVDDMEFGDVCRDCGRSLIRCRCMPGERNRISKYL